MPQQQDPYAEFGGKSEGDPYAEFGGSVQAPAALLSERVSRLKAQNETPVPKPPPLPTTLATDPRGFLHNRMQELQQSSAEQHAQGTGPESQGKPFMLRLGHQVLALAPETAEVLDKVASGLMDWKTAAAFAASKISPAVAAAYFMAQGIQQAGEANEPGKVFSATPHPENVQNFLLGLSQAAGGAAGAAGSPKTAIEGTAMQPAQLGTAESSKAAAPGRIQKFAQRVVGAGPERTTVPLVQKYESDVQAATEAQAAANAKAEGINQGKTEAGFTKAGEQKVGFEKAVREQQEAHAAKVADVEAKNAEAARIEQQRTSLTNSVNNASRDLGESIKSLDEALRQEGNEKYAAVKEATAADPGVPLAELSKEAIYAEQNILKGSQENIKQFRELIRKAPEAEGVMTSAGMAVPGDPLYEALVAQGALDTGGNIQFDQLRGYSSELGTKLASGNLAGDVYQAMKYLKEKIDAQKAVIADRNGVGGQLRAADGFWRDYMATFYDRPSAVAATRERVGKYDPQFYAEPFTKGKTAQTSLAALKNIKTEMPATQDYITRVAQLADTVRQQQAELSGLPKTRQLPIPEPPKGIEAPKPVEVKYATPKQIEPPTAPTLEDVRQEKLAKVRAKAAEVQGLRRFDLMVLAGSPIAGLFSGRSLTSALTGLAGGIAAEVAVKGLAMQLDRPRVQQWLSQPRPEDIAILNKLPEATKAGVRERMQNFITEETKQGHAPIVASAVQQFLGAAVMTPKTPGQMRKEIQAIQRKYASPATSNPNQPHIEQ